jgi:hypothetical protein
MASKHPIIRLRVCMHRMVGHFMVLSLAQAAVVSHGAEAVAEYLAAGEDSVVGERVNCMGAIDEIRGIDRFLISTGI